MSTTSREISLLSVSRRSTSPRNETREPTFREGHGPVLYTSLADQYFAYPFYYGRYANMAYIVMFDRADGIRLSMSPHGASQNPDGTTNPAWDWQ